jgi:hypothetical protein
MRVRDSGGTGFFSLLALEMPYFGATKLVLYFYFVDLMKM